MPRKDRGRICPDPVFAVICITLRPHHAEGWRKLRGRIAEQKQARWEHTWSSGLFSTQDTYVKIGVFVRGRIAEGFDPIGWKDRGRCTNTLRKTGSRKDHRRFLPRSIYYTPARREPLQTSASRGRIAEAILMGPLYRTRPCTTWV